MQCTCEQRDIVLPGTASTTSREPTPTTPSTRPYQQIVFNATGENTIFEWVSSSQSSQTSSRTRVRSHVMRRFRAQQALGQPYTPSSSTLPRPPLVSRRSGPFADYDPRIKHYYTCPNCGQLKTECCMSTTTGQHVESHIRVLLQPLPVDPTTESGQLYQYLSQVYAFIQNPVRRNGLGLVQYCFPFIISSAAVLNSLLSLVATHRMLVGGNNPAFTSAYYHHKVQAIQIINQSIAMHVNRVASDVLVAIAVLAIIEYTTGSIENAQSHINGLNQIMASHGASAAAPASHYFALRLMKLATLLTSNAMNNSPSTTAPQTTSLNQILATLPQDAHPSIHNMFRSLKHLSTTMPRTSTPDIDIAQQAEWLDRLNVTEFETHRILENDLSLQTVHGSSSFGEWRAYPIAGTIFLCLWLRQLAVQSNVFDYLVDSLAYALEEEDDDDEEDGDEEEKAQRYPTTMILWLLFVGGAAAEGRRKRQWFLVQISQTVRKLDLDSWQRTNELLMEFPYVDECEGSFKRIWEEIEIKNMLE